MNNPDTMVQTLAKSPLYQAYEKAFGDTTGLPLTLRSPHAWEVAHARNPHRNPFCVLMSRQSKTCAACLRVQQDLAENAKTDAYTTTCFAGLCDSAVPVRLGDQVVGYLQTGQVLLKKPSQSQLTRIEEQLNEWKIPHVEAEVRDAWMQSPVMNKKGYDAALQLVKIFAEHLSVASNQLAIRAENTEPPAIKRARVFIQEHLGERLSLSMVAGALHMSTFYFCKMFRKSTGLNFTDYVARERIEKAKNLLLNPNLRVSEIAYEVGFQSLTHFNRVFRRIVGRTPTVFRGRNVTG